MTLVGSEALVRCTDPARLARPLLICYLPVGDPMTSCATVTRYVDCGVDIVEAGIGVSSPALDGAVISASMQRSVAAGVVSQRAAEALAHQLSANNRPAAVWMSYQKVPDADYLATVAASGVQGVLLPGTTPAVLSAALAAVPAVRSLSAIPFLEHRPTAAQIEAARGAAAYVMLPSSAGVTGARNRVDPDNRTVLAGLRDDGVSAPIVLGFGIGTAAQACQAIALGAAGVVVGTACIRAALAGPRTLTAVLTDLRRALHE